MQPAFEIPAPDPTRGSRRSRAVVFGLFLLAVAYGFSAVGRQADTGNDFPHYLEAAKALLDGRSPYTPGSGLEGYVYLPFFALVLAPLAALPETAALWMWYLANVALTAGCFAILRSLLARVFGDRYAAWAVAVSLAVHARFFLGNYDVGQANILLLFLLLWSVRLAALDKRFWWSGWPLGMAAVIKPHALVVLVPFLIRRRWGMTAGVFSAIVAAGIVVPLIVLGGGATRRVTNDWYERVIAPARAGTLQGSAAHDQSPQAALRRLVVDEPAFDDVRVNRWSLTDEDYHHLKIALQAVLALVLAVAWLQPKRRGNDTALLIDVALAFIGMLVLFGYLTRPHFVMLLMPGAILAHLWRTKSAALTDRRVTTPLLAFSAAMIFLTTPLFVGRTLQQWTLAYSIITLATIVQLTILVIVRLRMTGRDRAAPPG